VIANEGYELVPLESVQPHPDNPRQGDVGAISESVKVHGFYGALVVQKSTGHILAGNHRWKAAKAAGLTELPVTYVDVDDEKARRILVADNRLSDLGTYDEAQLAEILKDLAATSAGLTGTGYDGDDLESLIRDLGHPYGALDTDDAVSRADELREKWDTAEGQVWQVGEHRVVCGDSREESTLYLATEGAFVDMLLTDPPYGINLDTDYSSMGGPSHAVRKPKPSRKYRPVIGDDAPFDPRLIAAYFSETPEQFWFGADHYRRLLSEDDRDGSWLVWDKRSEEVDAVFGSGFELIWSKQRHKRDLLRHYWNGGLGISEAENRSHPTQKPTPLLADILTRWSSGAALVADPYLGSGSTLVACQQVGRRGVGVELDPAYVAVTLERLSEMGLVPERVQ